MYGRTCLLALVLTLAVSPSATWADGPMFDGDGDGDIDLTDFAVFADCQTGPNASLRSANDGSPAHGALGGGETQDWNPNGDLLGMPPAHNPGPCRAAFDWDGDGDIDMADFARLALFFDGGNPIDCNNNGTSDALELAFNYTADCNANGIPDDCDIAAGTSEDCDNDGVPDECVEYGLAIEAIVPFSTDGEDGYRVTTAGGLFDILPSRIDIRRRIDPATNAVDPNAPIVARLTFDDSIGELAAFCQTAQSCELRAAAGLRISIGADSLVFLTAASRDPINYSYESLLDDPTWVGQKAPAEPATPGDSGNRMWARLGEGTIHMIPAGSEALVMGSTDPATPIHVTLPPDSRSAFAVFPSRPFDLERLYGDGARPHVIVSLNDYPHWLQVLGDAELERLAGEGFGTLVLFNRFYDDPVRPYQPHTTPDDPRLHYVFTHPGRVDAYIRAAHRHGYKVVAYMLPGAFSTDAQDIETTLQWMGEFQARHDLDGWYLDGAQPNPQSEWEDNYDFVRAVRRQVGDGGIIYHHTTVDVWGGRGSNVVFAPLEAWEDYTLRGEVGGNAQVTGPNDQFIPDICASHGGVLASQKVRSHGADMTIRETTRLFQQNLWGYYADNAWVVANQPFWSEHGLPHWRNRQADYASGGEFGMAYDWPPTWYREMDPDTEVTASATPTELTVEFTTHAFTYGEARVVYNDPNHYSFNHKQNENQIFEIGLDCTRGTNHTITIDLPDNPLGFPAYRVLVRAFQGAPADCNGGADDTMLYDVWGTTIVVPAVLDCNGNGISDAIDIAEGTSCDMNDNGVPDECEVYECSEGQEPNTDCPDADINCDGFVNGMDLGVITNAANWGKVVCSNDPPANPRADLNRDGVVTGLDETALRASPCW